MKSRTVIAFLKSKGWEYTGENQKFIKLKPPSEFKFEGEFELEIPKVETTITYLRHMRMITEAIASMYELDKDMLEMLFSKTLEEIKTERSLTSGMLAQA